MIMSFLNKREYIGIHDFYHSRMGIIEAIHIVMRSVHLLQKIYKL